MSGQNTFVVDRPIRQVSDIPDAGTIATQDADNVAITGGSITDITDLAIADGGTGQSTALAAFNALKQAATDAYTGVMLKSTDAKTIAGTDTESALTPGNLFARIPDGVADATLSGTPKIFCIKDSSGTPYYFKAYPTKE